MDLFRGLIAAEVVGHSSIIMYGLALVYFCIQSFMLVRFYVNIMASFPRISKNSNNENKNNYNTNTSITQISPKMKGSMTVILMAGHI